MNDEIKNEIEKAAELLGMSLDDATARFEEICSKNNVDAEKEPLLARSLWRQFFSNSRNVMKRQQTQPSGQDSNSLYKKAFGFFVALNDAIDMSARSRERLTNEYMRDSDMTYSLGRVAIFTEDGDGYEARMMRDGEEIVKHMKKLPENNVEVDSGRFIVPLDTRQGDWNKNYGKPQPASEYQRKGVFVGEVDGKMGKYFFSYKKEHCVKFEPKTFEFIHFDVIPNSNREDLIHGGANQTVESLVYNVDLADDSEMKRDVSQIVMSDAMMEYCGGNYSPLIALDKYHQTANNKANWDDRFVFTDGTVNSINVTPTANGNRILNLDDLNTDFDFDNDGWSGTTCWIPENIPIDFGIGSQVLVVGRTSQGVDQEGNIRPVSINVAGLHVISSRGGSAEEVEFIDESEDWFFE